MTENELTVNFDKVPDPTVIKDSLVNQVGQNDALIVNHFQKWLENREKGKK